MTNYELTLENLNQHLRIQLYFLDVSLSNFSKQENIHQIKNKTVGRTKVLEIHPEVEAVRLATIIRVLVHDTNLSSSLLKHLRKKSEMEFISSASPKDGRLHSMTGMKGVRGSGSEQYFGLVAKVKTDNSLIAVPLFQQHLKEWYSSYKKQNFEQWWESEIMKVNGHGHTRAELVKNVANKDGGAHVDGLIPEKYNLSKRTALNLNILGIKTEFERNVVYASIAQIAWELLNSIKVE